MSFKVSLILAVSMIWIVGCSTIYGVSHDYNENYDFSKARAYNWAPLKSDGEIKTETLNLVKSAVNSGLQEKGLQLSENEPDFFIVPYAGTKKKVMEVQPGPDVRNSWGYSGPYYGAPSGYEYEVGKLTLDFVDRKSNHLIWRGVAKADLDTISDTPGKKQQLIEEAVEKILQKFPPTKS